MTTYARSYIYISIRFIQSTVSIHYDMLNHMLSKYLWFCITGVSMGNR